MDKLIDLILSEDSSPMQLNLLRFLIATLIFK